MMMKTTREIYKVNIYILFPLYYYDKDDDDYNDSTNRTINKLFLFLSFNIYFCSHLRNETSILSILFELDAKL